MCTDWKDTNVVLIPKVKNPLLPSNYRPISLCNTIYKIVVSMLLNRMGNLFPKIISKVQYAFVKGRFMSDQILLAQELFHKFRFSKSKKGFVSIKVEMEQAYDSMCWPTLNQVLHWFGFLTKFSYPIMECVMNPNFSILINGKYSNWIESKCGFRQGCPLSPYLFIIGSISMKISPNAPLISHLMYADDLIIFSEANKISLKTISAILKNYCKWTGQVVNSGKSSLLFSKSISRSSVKNLSRLLNFKVVKELDFLGTKIVLRRLVKSDFNYLIDKAVAKLNMWGNKFISLAGKIVLLNASFLSLSIFVSTLSLVPLRILKEIDKMCKKFLWNKRDGSFGIHFVAWDVMCKPKSKGGRGVQSVLERIGPLRAKLALNFISNPSSLLNKMLTARYGNDLWKVEIDAILLLHGKLFLMELNSYTLF
ncbi:Putative ribonuclease H protein [Dendrobium catenatum]|uniref:Ribonuclease H protein n=1 Tax=Dendrobium catenatum TaxID=906689 RepID=A0A2I0X2Q3_9ASPA|nr:Putative ribonuclease H protein [Dendrobium catenatum]